MKAFFAFLAAILIAGIGFGFYVSGLEPCSKSTLGGLECHKLYLAFGVLFAVAIMLALGAAFYAFVPANGGAGDPPGKQIFDSFMKTLAPIATLVLGYYFGSTQTTTQSTKDEKPVTAAPAVAAGASEAAAPKK